MEKKNNEQGENKKEKIKALIDQMAKDKKKVVAKDLVELKHVETKKQEVSQETLDLARTLKEKLIIHDGFEELSNDELTILEAFGGKRLFLTRIAIIVNQSRIPLGLEGFKKAELESLLEGLIKKGYVESEMINDQRVYYLTERGKYRIQ
ncbi:MAG: hypothetical protein ACTSVV_01185 [Promethearchaeota archaeon]